LNATIALLKDTSNYSMHNSESKFCVNLTIIVIVSIACIVLGVGIYALAHTTNNVELTATNTTIPRPDLLTKTANIAKNSIKPLKSITSAEADDTDLSGI
jgi:hypothetical protein